MTMLVQPARFGAGGGTGILDGTSPTGAWSMSRDLLTSFGGGTKYTTATGIDSWKDQSGNSRHLDQTVSSTRQPTVTTAGPLSRAAANFDGTDDHFSGAAISNFIAAGAGYAIISFVVDAIAADQKHLLGDNGTKMGLLFYDTPDEIVAFNDDGTGDFSPAIGAGVAMVAGTAYVAEWRHEGGTVYLRVNGTAWSAGTASGNTSALTNPLIVGGRSAGGYADVKVFEAAIWSTVPAAATRDAIAADFKSWVGA